MKVCRILLFVVGAAVCSLTAAPLPFAETFDGLAAGAINGQNGWNATGTTARVQSSNVYQGQALEITDASVDHDLTGTTNSVWLSFRARCTALSDQTPTVTDPDTSVAFFVNTNGFLTVYSNTTPVELSVQMPLDVWTRFDVYCDYDALTWNLSVNKTNVAAGLPLYSAGRRVSGLHIQNNASSAAYVDSIAVSDREPVEDPVDTDGDDLPDWWEYRHFGSVSAGRPGDMASNRVNDVRGAYIAGLDPHQSERFRMKRLDPVGRKLSWRARPGRRYSVYWSTNLLEGFSLVRSGLTGDGDLQVPVTNRASGFYRVEVELDTP